MAICKISQRFFSPPEKPSLTERAVNLEQVHFFVEPLVIGGGVQLLALAEASLQRGAEEIGDAHAGDFARVLEREEKAGAGALVGLQFEDRTAVEEHFAAGDRVIRVAGDGLGQRGFAGAVGAHDGMNLTLADGEREALDDFLFADGDMEVFDFE
jgi:hypothetical protein